MKPIYIAYSASLSRMAACAMSLTLLGITIYLIKSGRELKLLIVAPLSLLCACLIAMGGVLDAMINDRYTQALKDETEVLKNIHPSETMIQLVIIKYRFILQALKIFRDSNQQISKDNTHSTATNDEPSSSASTHDSPTTQDVDEDTRIIDAIVASPDVVQELKRPMREYLRDGLVMPLQEILLNDYPAIWNVVKDRLTISGLTEALCAGHTAVAVSSSFLKTIMVEGFETFNKEEQLKALTELMWHLKKNDQLIELEKLAQRTVDANGPHAPVYRSFKALYRGIIQANTQEECQTLLKSTIASWPANQDYTYTFVLTLILTVDKLNFNAPLVAMPTDFLSSTLDEFIHGNKKAQTYEATNIMFMSQLKLMPQILNALIDKISKISSGSATDLDNYSKLKQILEMLEKAGVGDSINYGKDTLGMDSHAQLTAIVGIINSLEDESHKHTLLTEILMKIPLSHSDISPLDSLIDNIQRGLDTLHPQEKLTSAQDALIHLLWSDDVVQRAKFGPNFDQQLMDSLPHPSDAVKIKADTESDIRESAEWYARGYTKVASYIVLPYLPSLASIWIKRLQHPRLKYCLALVSFSTLLLTIIRVILGNKGIARAFYLLRGKTMGTANKHLECYQFVINYINCSLQSLFHPQGIAARLLYDKYHNFLILQAFTSYYSKEIYVLETKSLKLDKDLKLLIVSQEDPTQASDFLDVFISYLVQTCDIFDDVLSGIKIEEGAKYTAQQSRQISQLLKQRLLRDSSVLKHVPDLVSKALLNLCFVYTSGALSTTADFSGNVKIDALKKKISQTLIALKVATAGQGLVIDNLTKEMGEIKDQQEARDSGGRATEAVDTYPKTIKQILGYIKQTFELSVIIKSKRHDPSPGSVTQHTKSSALSLKLDILVPKAKAPDLQTQAREKTFRDHLTTLQNLLGERITASKYNEDISIEVNDVRNDHGRLLSHSCNIIKTALENFIASNDEISQNNAITALGYAQFYVNCLDRLDFLISKGAEIILPKDESSMEADTESTNKPTTQDACPCASVKIITPDNATDDMRKLAQFLEIIIDNSLISSETPQTFHAEGTKGYCLLRRNLYLISALFPQQDYPTGRTPEDRIELLKILKEHLGIPGKSQERGAPRSV